MSFDEAIINALRTSSLGFREDDKYFKEGLCPSCGQKMLYIKKSALYKVVCSRKNKCHYQISIRDLFPSLFRQISKNAPATPEDPTKTADTYLTWIRGFKDLTPFKGHYEQGIRKIKGVEYPTVRFHLTEEIYWEKLIDCPSRDSHFEGRYAGLAWTLHPVEELTGKIFLTEGIFDALALETVGQPAISVMSASHIPETFLKALLGKNILWHVAYDNDKAGVEGIRKMVAWLQSQEEKAIVSLPALNKDWNDHLRNGTIEGDDFFNECRFRGRLVEAQDPKEYGSILAEKYHMPLCFEFDNCYWGIGQEKNEVVVSRQSNFSLELYYTLFNEATEETQYVFNVLFRNKSRPKEISLSSTKIANLQAFREGVLSRAPGAIWKGQQQIFYFNLLEKYFKKPPIEVRCLEQIGYDETTDSYVFADHAFNAEGQLIMPNRHKFVELSDKPDAKIKVIAGARKNRFKVTDRFDWSVTNTLIDAWSWEGYCVFAMFYLSLFSEQIGRKLSWFPFMSVYGPPNTGKSTLITWLWKLLGRDFEGIQATDNFTAKYIGRNLALFSGIPSVIKEINKASTKFDLETLLPAFDRDPIIGRAKVTNGLETSEYPFRTSLIFVQNDEPFHSKQLKSRIISLYFSDKRFNLHNRESLDASKRIKQHDIDDVCGFRHQILSNHREHAQNLLNAYPVHEERFLKLSETSRVAQNYALLWTGCEELGKKVPRWKEIRSSCFNYLVESIKEKERMLQQDNFMLNRFFEVLDDLVTSNRLTNHAPALKQKEEVRFSWKEFQMLAIEDRQTDLFRDVPQLQSTLQGTTRFIKYDSMWSEREGRRRQLWAFSGDFRNTGQLRFDLEDQN